MTVRELIAERTQGIPMQAAAMRGQQRRRGEVPAAARRGAMIYRPGMTDGERMAAEDAEVVAHGPELAGDRAGSYARGGGGGGGGGRWSGRATS